MAHRKLIQGKYLPYQYITIIMKDSTTSGTKRSYYLQKFISYLIYFSFIIFMFLTKYGNMETLPESLVQYLTKNNCPQSVPCFIHD